MFEIILAKLKCKLNSFTLFKDENSHRKLCLFQSKISSHLDIIHEKINKYSNFIDEQHDKITNFCSLINYNAKLKLKYHLLCRLSSRFAINDPLLFDLVKNKRTRFLINPRKDLPLLKSKPWNEKKLTIAVNFDLLFNETGSDGISERNLISRPGALVLLGALHANSELVLYTNLDYASATKVAELINFDKTKLIYKNDFNNRNLKLSARRLGRNENETIFVDCNNAYVNSDNLIQINKDGALDSSLINRYIKNASLYPQGISEYCQTIKLADVQKEPFISRLLLMFNI